MRKKFPVRDVGAWESSITTVISLICLETYFDEKYELGKTINEQVTEDVNGEPFLVGSNPIRFRYNDIYVDEIQIRFPESYGQIAELDIDLLV